VIPRTVAVTEGESPVVAAVTAGLDRLSLVTSESRAVLVWIPSPDALISGRVEPPVTTPRRSTMSIRHSAGRSTGRTHTSPARPATRPSWTPDCSDCTKMPQISTVARHWRYRRVADPLWIARCTTGGQTRLDGGQPAPACGPQKIL